MAQGRTNSGGKKGPEYGKRITVSEATSNSFVKNGKGRRRISSRGAFDDENFRNQQRILGYVPTLDKCITLRNDKLSFLNSENFRLENTMDVLNVSSSNPLDFKKARLIRYQGYYDLTTKTFHSLDQNATPTFDDKYFYTLVNKPDNKVQIKVYGIDRPHSLVYSKLFTIPNGISDVYYCLTFDLDNKIGDFATRNGIARINIETGEILNQGGHNKWYSCSYLGFSHAHTCSLISAYNYNSSDSMHTAIAYDVKRNKILKQVTIAYDDRSDTSEYANVIPTLASDEVILFFSEKRRGYTEQKYFDVYHKIDNILIDTSISNSNTADGRYLVETFNNDYRMIHGPQYAFAKGKELIYPYGKNYITALSLVNSIVWNEKD